MLCATIEALEYHIAQQFCVIYVFVVSATSSNHGNHRTKRRRFLDNTLSSTLSSTSSVSKWVALWSARKRAIWFPPNHWVGCRNFYLEREHLLPPHALLGCGGFVYPQYNSRQRTKQPGNNTYDDACHSQLPLISHLKNAWVGHDAGVSPTSQRSIRMIPAARRHP